MALWDLFAHPHPTPCRPPYRSSFYGWLCCMLTPHAILFWDIWRIDVFRAASISSPTAISARLTRWSRTCAPTPSRVCWLGIDAILNRRHVPAGITTGHRLPNDRTLRHACARFAMCPFLRTCVDRMINGARTLRCSKLTASGADGQSLRPTDPANGCHFHNAAASRIAQGRAIHDRLSEHAWWTPGGKDACQKLVRQSGANGRFLVFAM